MIPYATYFNKKYENWDNVVTNNVDRYELHCPNAMSLQQNTA
jgi:hypothetical protein